jgi:hypothetical protein
MWRYCQIIIIYWHFHVVQLSYDKVFSILLCSFIKTFSFLLLYNLISLFSHQSCIHSLNFLCSQRMLLSSVHNVHLHHIILHFASLILFTMLLSFYLQILPNILFSDIQVSLLCTERHYSFQSLEIRNITFFGT